MIPRLGRDHRKYRRQCKKTNNMNIWENDRWKKFVNIENQNLRSGLALRFQKGVDSEVRRSCIEFAEWLRSQYYFPIRVPAYFKASRYVKTQSGELVSAKFFEPFDRMVEPYITIATGDIDEIKQRRGKDNALAAILRSLAHELTHYFQWINDVDLTDEQSERQAKYYSTKIVDLYAMTREHP